MSPHSFTIAEMRYNKAKRCTEIIELNGDSPIIHNLPKEASLSGSVRPGDTITWTDQGQGHFTIYKGETLIATYREAEKRKRDAFYEVEKGNRGLTMLREQTMSYGFGKHNY